MLYRDYQDSFGVRGPYTSVGSWKLEKQLNSDASSITNYTLVGLRLKNGKIEPQHGV